jgi:bis(5'-nucleosyl)-tetraphosphatase (symmetrical)
MMEVLEAPDRKELLGWLRQQPLARYELGVLMVHAGVLPQWTLNKTLKWARRLHEIIREEDLAHWLPQLWGNPTYAWSKELSRNQKLRLALNAFTRMRFCDARGIQNYEAKTAIAPEGCCAWFEVPERRTQTIPIAFGHWSTLGLWNKPYLLGLDTACVWGGSLSALRLHGAWTLDPSLRQFVHVPAV